jgi:hypothetical protein
MSENKKALSTGQVESAEGCAGARIEGERNSNPSKIVYHENNRSSIPYEEYFPKYLGMGIKEKTCAWCGKNFCPTPQWVYGDCCRYTCALRYDEMKQEELSNAREVVLVNPDTLEDVTKFKNAKEAADFANTSAKDIRLVCNGLRETAGKYAWRWADEEPLRVKDLIPIYESEPKAKMSVAICRSAHQRLEKIAYERGISKNKVAREILEKALLKEYEL